MSYKKKEDDFLPHVSFTRGNVFSDKDVRRMLQGVSGDLEIPVLKLSQIKIINFSEEAVKENKVIGNHKHYGISGQWEIIIVLGEKTFGKIFRFRYRNYNDKIHEKYLVPGDVVIVPPGCSLALVPLKSNASIIEISNKEYDSKNYIKDDLFAENL